MNFSKKTPLKITFEERTNVKNRNIQIEAVKQIKNYKKLLKYDKNMPEDLREEVNNAIRMFRGRLKFNKIKDVSANLSYKGIKVKIPVNDRSIDIESYAYYKEKVIKALKRKREFAKKKMKERRKIEGQEYILQGGVHEKYGSIMDLYDKVAMRRLNTLRKPKANENHVGVEIEFFSPITDRDVICKKFIDSKLSLNCRIMTDGSIRPRDGTVGWELCIVAPESKILQVLENAYDVLMSIDADVNESCGLHVHLDARNRDKEVLYHNLVKCQSLLFNMVPKERRDNRYCFPQKTTEWEKAYHEHYAAINKNSYFKHKTIEVRMHHGTLEIAQIKNWVQFLTSIANYNEKLGPEYKKPSRSLKNELELDDKLYGYVKERTKLYA